MRKTVTASPIMIQTAAVPLAAPCSTESSYVRWPSQAAPAAQRVANAASGNVPVRRTEWIVARVQEKYRSDATRSGATPGQSFGAATGRARYRTPKARAGAATKADA